MSDTIAAIATGNQVAAIGIIRLSGDEAINIVNRLFKPQSGKTMASYGDRKLVYGRLENLAGEQLDLCLCTISHAPNSYTGENTAELQCHGSPVLLRAALEELFRAGARQALPGEFTKRAFLNGRMDLSSAEAVADIIDAESVQCVKNAAAQLSGAVTVKTEKIYAFLADISSHYHAVLDYPDEDIEDFLLENYVSGLRDAKRELGVLLSSFERGKLMQNGIPAAIVGRPNAGKSSLLNALLGYERAIVTDIPGTTRDTIEEKLRIGSLTLRLTDTAGIRDSEDKVEQLGVERSRLAMERSELVIAVVDGSAELNDEDMEIIRRAEKAPKAILVISKADLEQQGQQIESSLPCVSISSLTGEGLDRLEKEIEKLFPLPEVPAGEILTNLRHAQAVSAALESINAALEAMEYGATPDIVLTESETAMAALGELSGRSIREDVTNRIFQRFCVGK
ncbi:MAG: tRNA uridine-5-carboxymethylaminomethyl(34) synthesis GTPase MnmE [Oscillospiraceae bacterium]|nr:tRNA uridine-5-carboxymethylaminomethyl(34) synthesis GTPase MnmE [Oscillospiraceae bacterium]